MEQGKLTDDEKVELIKSHLFENLDVLKSLEAKKEANYPISMSALSNTPWEVLKHLCEDYEVDNIIFLEAQKTKDKTNLVIELRKKIREFKKYRERK